MSVREFMRRVPSAACRLCPLKAGLGGLLGIGLVGLLAQMVGNPWSIAPLAATSVLVFAAPDSPMARPANVILGHMLSTSVALVMDSFLPGGWMTAALGVGVVIALMGMVRLTHPPAGADALVVLTSHPGASYLIFPILVGSLALVAVAVALHRFVPPRGSYPHPVAQPIPQPD